MFSLIELDKTSKVSDEFGKASDLFKEHNLLWEKFVGMCAVDASTIVGSCSGFVVSQRKNQAMYNWYWPRYPKVSLSCRTLPDDLCITLNLCTKVINLVKKRSLNLRLFARLGRDLGTCHKSLLVPHRTSLFVKRKYAYSPTWAGGLSMSSRFFETIKKLNFKLQRKNATIIVHFDAISAFFEKIYLWISKEQKGNIPSFLHFNVLMAGNKDLDQYGADIKRKLHLIWTPFLRNLCTIFKMSSWTRYLEIDTKSIQC